jgi:uncharacterized protein YhhL (DUF1145 family)
MIGKILTLGLWALALGCFVFSYPEPWHTLAFWTTIALSVAHVVECIVFAKRVQFAGGNKPLHFLQIFIFGFFHASTLPESESEAS